MIKYFETFEKTYRLVGLNSLHVVENLFSFTIFYFMVSYEILRPEIELVRKQAKGLQIEHEKDWIFVILNR
jgi:hypothetical protein